MNESIINASWRVIIANQDDEGNGNDESNGFNNAVKFVPSEELQVTTHGTKTIKTGISLSFFVPKLQLSKIQIFKILPCRKSVKNLYSECKETLQSQQIHQFI